MRTLAKLICMGTCCIAINALGQTNDGQGMDPQQRVAYINQHVTNLTPDQQSKIMAIEQEYLSNLKIVNVTATDSLRRVTDNSIRAVLSNQQYEQYQSLTMYPH